MPRIFSGGFSRWFASGASDGDLIVVNADGSSVGVGTGAAPSVVRLEGGATTNLAYVGPNGDLAVTAGGRQTTAIAAGTAANTVVKATAGRLGRVLVTATGAAALTVYDNATTNSGTVIAVIAAAAAAGTIVDFQMPAANGITVAGDAACPGVTISWT